MILKSVISLLWRSVLEIIEMKWDDWNEVRWFQTLHEIYIEMISIKIIFKLWTLSEEISIAMMYHSFPYPIMISIDIINSLKSAPPCPSMISIVMMYHSHFTFNEHLNWFDFKSTLYLNINLSWLISSQLKFLKFVTSYPQSIFFLNYVLSSRRICS
jgi:hypothetical protein